MLSPGPSVSGTILNVRQRHIGERELQRGPDLVAGWVVDRMGGLRGPAEDLYVMKRLVPLVAIIAAVVLGTPAQALTKTRTLLPPGDVDLTRSSPFTVHAHDLVAHEVETDTFDAGANLVRIDIHGHLVSQFTNVGSAFLMLRLASDQLRTWELRHAATMQPETSPWIASIGSAVTAGVLFGLATWFSFTRIRFLPSRLLLAAVTLLPVAHFWWTLIEGHVGTGAVNASYWFDGFDSQFVFAALVGVAIASCFAPNRSGRTS